MKIGFDAKRLFHNNTGLGNYSRDLVRVLTRYFPENEYFLFTPKINEERNKTFNQFSNVKTIAAEGFWKKIHPIWRSYRIGNLMEKYHLDIYHGLSGELPVRIPKSMKTVVTVHDLIFVRYPHLYHAIDRKIYFQKFKSACTKADVVVAISEQTKKDIVEFLGISPSKIQVIYQGCAQVFKETYPHEDLQKTREKFGLPKEFILNVGTIEERKNALTIVKTLKDLDTKLVIIGRATAYEKQVRDYIESHNLQDRVLFLQGVSQVELAHIYQLASVFVYPSIFEGFGIPIIEALNSGTPVITNESGVFPEAGGPDSLYIKPDDVSGMAEKIHDLLTHPEERKRIAEKGKAFVRKFDDDQWAPQWDRLYRSLLQ